MTLCAHLLGIFVLFVSVTRSATYRSTHGIPGQLSLLRSKLFTFDHNYRLPANLVPTNYQLTYRFTHGRLRFSGQVAIEVYCAQSTHTVTLHAHPHWLKIKAASVNNSRLWQAPRRLHRWETNPRRQTVTFHSTDDEFRLHRWDFYTLTIDFETEANAIEKLGFHVHLQSHFKPYFSTQFEMTFARTFLPCFDEPHFKAAFTLTVVIKDKPNDYQVLTNTAVRNVSETTDCDYRIEFHKTPHMSTYLLVFIYGRFDTYCQAYSPFRKLRYYKHLSKEICVHSWKGLLSTMENSDALLNKTLFFLRAADRHMATLFNHESPTNLHALFVPMDAAGMEHWGLISLQRRLLYGDWKVGVTSTKDITYKQLWKTVVHEVVHQWLGNLVTPRWWNDIWLSESLTTLYTYLTLKEINYGDVNLHLFEYQNWMQFHDVYNSSLRSDKWTQSIPLLVYRKGALVVNMLRQIIGAETFSALMLEFVSRYKYSSASTEDFLALLREFVPYNRHAVRFMHNWLHTPTHPILNLRYDPTTREFFLRQAPNVKSRTGDVRWLVPIWSYCPTSGNETLWWMRPDTGILLLRLEQVCNSSARDIEWNRNHVVAYKINMSVK